MCTPIALAAGSLAIGAISSISSYDASQRQADAARRSADQDYQLRQQTLAEQKVQFTQQATEEMSDRAREALIERSRITTAAGEAGIDGNTVNRLFTESEFNKGHDITSIQHNYGNRVKQAELEAQGAAATYQNQVNQIESNRMTIGQLGLGLASDAFDAGKTYMNWSTSMARVDQSTRVTEHSRVRGPDIEIPVKQSDWEWTKKNGKLVLGK